MKSTSRALATYVQWVSVLLIIAAVIVLIRILPVDRAVEALSGWAGEVGIVGPIVIGLIYIAGTLLFIPGSALTLAAGALFGPWKGTVTVSLASTTGAALAFLIARYLARRKVEQQAKRYPKFAAIDKAIGEGGWRIIAMLRLTPVVPFNLSNYLFGLTAIRFWPCVLTSWIAMMPATFMFVYLGHIGSQGVAAAAGVSSSRSPGEWVLLGVGFLATVGVTVYVTRIAGRAIKERTEIETTMNSTEPEPETQTESRPATWPVSATITAVLAVILTGTAAYAHKNRDAIQGPFGPISATLVEAYDSQEGSSMFDHSAFEELLKRHVDADGWVNYEGLKTDAGQLDGYIQALGKAPFDTFGRDQKLAFLINAYNAFTLRLILDHYPIESIKDIPGAKRWKDKRWSLAGKIVSIDDIEHKEIRPKFREPRIHFALVCAAVGCPKLRNEAYHADRLERQLDDQTRYVHTHDRWFRFGPDGNVVHLTELYDWYGGDFKQVAGSVLAFAARYSPPLKEAIDSKRKLKTKWLGYDWKLNDKKNAP